MQSGNEAPLRLSVCSSSVALPIGLTQLVVSLSLPSHSAKEVAEGEAEEEAAEEQPVIAFPCSLGQRPASYNKQKKLIAAALQTRLSVALLPISTDIAIGPLAHPILSGLVSYRVPPSESDRSTVTLSFCHCASGFEISTRHGRFSRRKAGVSCCFVQVKTRLS